MIMGLKWIHFAQEGLDYKEQFNFQRRRGKLQWLYLIE